MTDSMITTLLPAPTHAFCQNCQLTPFVDLGNFLHSRQQFAIAVVHHRQEVVAVCRHACWDRSGKPQTSNLDSVLTRHDVNLKVAA